MKNLHGITIAGMETYIWAYIIGGNGRVLGQPNVRRWLGRPVHHAFLIQRGTPPEFGSRWPGREYWRPWQRPRLETMPVPVCGPIRTQARRFQMGWGNADRNPNYCPDCQRLMPNTAWARALMQADPWFLMPLADRTANADPVSGV